MKRNSLAEFKWPTHGHAARCRTTYLLQCPYSSICFPLIPIFVLLMKGQDRQQWSGRFLIRTANCKPFDFFILKYSLKQSKWQTEWGKDPNAGKDWRQKEKGTTEDQMAGWHHGLNGCEFEQALGDGEGQESLACCSLGGHKESDTTEWLNNKTVNILRSKAVSL